MAVAFGLVLLGLVLFSLVGPIFNWPSMDEGNYILQSWQIAHGQLPYRDFYEFITPGGQVFGALFLWAEGFSILGLRLLVLCGWLLTLILVYDMTRNRLSRSWQVLLLCFLWLTQSRYPIFQHHFWSGLCAVVAVYFAWRALQCVYIQQTRLQAGAKFLILCGLFTGQVFWITQSLGVLLVGALGVYSFLHALLHEREERGVTFKQLSMLAVVRRWLATWGLCWFLPMVAVHLAWVGAFVALGIWDAFWRDSVSWLWAGHYQRTTVFGYFTTFHQEFMETVRPFIDQVPMPYLLLFLARLPIVAHLLLIGLLPVLGIVGTGVTLPGRLIYRMLRQEDEEQLLFLLASIALVLSTFNYSASMHISSNGAIPMMLGWMVAGRWLASRPGPAAEVRVITVCLFLMLLVGAVIGSWLQLVGGVWLPRFKGMMEPLLYTDAQTNAAQFLTVVNVLERAKGQGRSIFVFSETPSLYLPGGYSNATRFTLILPFYNSPAQMEEIMADLERNKPLYIIDDLTRFRLPTDGRFAQYTTQDLAMPVMEDYIHTHYQLKGIAGRFHVYRRTAL